MLACAQGTLGGTSTGCVDSGSFEAFSEAQEQEWHSYYRFSSAAVITKHSLAHRKSWITRCTAVAAVGGQQAPDVSKIEPFFLKLSKSRVAVTTMGQVYAYPLRTRR